MCCQTDRCPDAAQCRVKAPRGSVWLWHVSSNMQRVTFVFPPLLLHGGAEGACARTWRDLNIADATTWVRPGLVVRAMAAMVSPCLLLSLMLPAAAQRFASFDAATASSVYSSKTFGADLATTESSGYWCSAGDHEPGQIVSWTGTFRSRRQLLGLTLRWSYAPGPRKLSKC